MIFTVDHASESEIEIELAPVDGNLLEADFGLFRIVPGGAPPLERHASGYRSARAGRRMSDQQDRLGDMTNLVDRRHG
jgi:hypothetical protein